MNLYSQINLCYIYIHACVHTYIPTYIYSGYASARTFPFKNHPFHISCVKYASASCTILTVSCQSNTITSFITHLSWCVTSVCVYIIVIHPVLHRSQVMWGKWADRSDQTFPLQQSLTMTRYKESSPLQAVHCSVVHFDKHIRINLK